MDAEPDEVVRVMSLHEPEFGEGSYEEMTSSRSRARGMDRSDEP